MNDVRRGAIYAEEHYIHAKMLDHSCWQEGEQACWQKDAPRLPRLITASDIDGVFWRLLNDPLAVPIVLDNDKKMIFAELSSSQQEWLQVSNGQFRLYRGLLEGPHCAVLCRHQVKPEDGRKICTRHDIVSFQPMFWDHGVVIGRVQGPNEAWQNFVLKWFADSIRVRRIFIGTSVGMKMIPDLKVI